MGRASAGSRTRRKRRSFWAPKVKSFGLSESYDHIVTHPRVLAESVIVPMIEMRTVGSGSSYKVGMAVGIAILLATLWVHLCSAETIMGREVSAPNIYPSLSPDDETVVEDDAFRTACLSSMKYLI